jgi:hypothetical protein
LRHIGCSGDLEGFPLIRGLNFWKIQRHRISKPQVPAETIA